MSDRTRLWKPSKTILSVACAAIASAGGLTAAVWAGGTGSASITSQPAQPADYVATDQWLAPGSSTTIPAESSYPDSSGKFGILSTDGPIETQGHPFFQPLGKNGRACVTCHQPANGMSISAATIQARWQATDGKDPLFDASDGSNCPNLPQDKASSHSLLLSRGLFRIALPWPPAAADGTPIKPEFKIEVVQDPTGCNSDPTYGLNSPHPTISVYRRPRPVMNMKYIAGDFLGSQAYFNPKNSAQPLPIDPDTGKRTPNNIMADARDVTLKLQAIDATEHHLGMLQPPNEATLQRIVSFESQIIGGQVWDNQGGSLEEPGGPKALGVHNLATNPAGTLGDTFDTPAFHDFNVWKQSLSGEPEPQRQFRESVARGYDVFFKKPFWIRDAQYINTLGLGNPIKRTCATCHNTQMTGMDLTSGWVDLGTQNLPWAEQGLDSPLTPGGGPQLPLFKITCNPDVPPHMFLGRVIYTHDPGRALVTGRCSDVGAIVMQQFRGLAARAPYFSNGSAASLLELVDFYDRRFNIGYSAQEKIDLVNFMSVL
jgi:hypothetical protein